MKLLYVFACPLLLLLGSCCSKQGCDMEYAGTVFTGFTAAELDTVRVVIEDMTHSYPPDTLYTEAVFYAGGGERASLTGSLPFRKECSYTYYLPATGTSYVVDGYEFSSETCSSCFPSTARGDYHDVVSAYRVNGIRYEDRFFVIRK